MSIEISRGPERTKDKLLLPGAARSSVRGVPPAFFKIQERNQKRKEEITGTSKVAVLKDDESNTNSLALSAHDAKPTHFITNCLSETKWTEKKNKSHD